MFNESSKSSGTGCPDQRPAVSRLDRRSRRVLRHPFVVLGAERAEGYDRDVCCASSGKSTSRTSRSWRSTRRGHAHGSTRVAVAVERRRSTASGRGGDLVSRLTTRTWKNSSIMSAKIATNLQRSGSATYGRQRGRVVAHRTRVATVRGSKNLSGPKERTSMTSAPIPRRR